MYTSRFARPIPVTLSKSEIVQVAEAVVFTLRALGFQCVLVGGAACGAFGISRVATDVDVVVLTTDVGQEEIKRRLVAKDPKFILVASKNPYASYKVLWYEIPPSPSSPSSLYAASRSCKVDVLVPGIMSIPDVPRGYSVVTISGEWKGLPLMPFIPLLMLKLQAWMDHRQADKQYLREKQHTDVRDIGELLDIGMRRKYTLAAERAWIPASFIQAAERRIPEYLVYYPLTADEWKKIGFTWISRSSSSLTHANLLRSFNSLST
ncbi:hypothetical protein PLEOSDRAFT_27394 [Pleurotus ostreatus PC15]|uniref:Uncharacterized protein n=2 Tax=Pleurotus TaxID=5320 RepID=A0A067P1R4_PLEO1|nr:hypothetical protein CCMSSC00406_0001320 [Pleurotus cornucopiae]KDQ29796.1 hypothetical protein PLEOSDRAFT_27394 [Pleurotus ostreatus PC15]